jgi:hypothetical protein
MSTKVEVYASPGWEAEVDTDWAEGLFAVFLRSARGRRRGPNGKTRVIPKGEVSDGVILLTVRKEEGEPELDAEVPAPPAPGDTRRTRRPRKSDDRTARTTPTSQARPMPVRPDRKPAAAPGRPSGRTTLKGAVVPPPPPPSTQEMQGVARFLEEMSTLIKYGHVAQARAEFDRQLVAWPDDVRFRRLMVGFFQDRGLVPETIDGLFGLATIHFDRREITQMRACLDEVLRLDPTSRRARKMRELLERRPGRPKVPA